MRQTRVERSPSGLFLLADPAGLTAPIRNHVCIMLTKSFLNCIVPISRDTFATLSLFVLPISGYFRLIFNFFFLGALVSKSDSKCSEPIKNSKQSLEQ